LTLESQIDLTPRKPLATDLYWRDRNLKYHRCEPFDPPGVQRPAWLPRWPSRSHLLGI